MDNNKIINLDYLKEFMKKNGLSEVKLAKLIGVDYSTVFRVFKGDRNPGTKFIAGLIQSGLDIDYDKIFLTAVLPSGKTKQQTA